MNVQNGLVPIPFPGDNSKFLCSDGSWKEPNTKDYFLTSSGIWAPATYGDYMYLCGNGEWQTMKRPWKDFWVNFEESEDGLHNTLYLCETEEQARQCCKNEPISTDALGDIDGDLQVIITILGQEFWNYDFTNGWGIETIKVYGSIVLGPNGLIGFATGSPYLKNIKDLAKINVSNVIDISSFFSSITIPWPGYQGVIFPGSGIPELDLSPINNWDLSSIVSCMNIFAYSEIKDFTPLNNWRISQDIYHPNAFEGATGIRPTWGVDW